MTWLLYRRWCTILTHEMFLFPSAEILYYHNTATGVGKQTCKLHKFCIQWWYQSKYNCYITSIVFSDMKIQDCSSRSTIHTTEFISCNNIQWWFVYPDTFVPGRYFRIDKFSGLMNRPLIRMWKSVLTLFVRTSETSRLLEPGLMNHHSTCVWLPYHVVPCVAIEADDGSEFDACLVRRGCVAPLKTTIIYIYL